MSSTKTMRKTQTGRSGSYPISVMVDASVGVVKLGRVPYVHDLLASLLFKSILLPKKRRSPHSYLYFLFARLPDPFLFKRQLVPFSHTHCGGHSPVRNRLSYHMNILRDLFLRSKPS